MTLLDLVVIGAGPAGLSVSAAARKAGLSHLVLERGPLAATIVAYPEDTIFFSTPENLEVGGVPFVTGGDKPTKRQALVYYRRVVQALDLPLRTFTRVVGISGEAPTLVVHTEDLHGRAEDLRTRAVALATGAHDRPRRLGIPGEDLPHVFHEYDGPWSGFGRPVLVVGGRNSAVEAALDLYRNGAAVTLSYRKERFPDSVKYWLRPDVENRIQEGSIRAFMPSAVKEIHPGRADLELPDGGSVEVAADFVYLRVGYVADPSFLVGLGIRIGDRGVPVHDPSTRETNVPGIYLAGRICAGDEAGRIFIENGREHGPVIVRHLLGEGG